LLVGNFFYLSLFWTFVPLCCCCSAPLIKHYYFFLFLNFDNFWEIMEKWK
jgi:hypothetical protein